MNGDSGYEEWEKNCKKKIKIKDSTKEPQSRWKAEKGNREIRCNFRHHGENTLKARHLAVFSKSIWRLWKWLVNQAQDGFSRSTDGSFRSASSRGQLCAKVYSYSPTRTDTKWVVLWLNGKALVSNPAKIGCTRFRFYLGGMSFFSSGRYMLKGPGTKALVACLEFVCKNLILVEQNNG